MPPSAAGGRPLGDPASRGSVRGIVDAALRRRPLIAYAAIVLANYAVQVPYALDLYGMHVSRTGTLLLGATFAWFVVGLALFLRGRRAGYWVLLAYVVAQLAFYVHGDVLLTFAGYGLPYQLTHARDAVVWAAFLIGGLDLVAAAITLGWLLVRRRELAGPA